MSYGRYFHTCLGKLYAEVEDGYVVRLTEGNTGEEGIDAGGEEKPGVSAATGAEAKEAMELLNRTERELKEYFEGKRDSFDLPVKAAGTAFQEKVWEALKKIPYGETRSYGAVAAEVGSPKGARAVGMACNRNPVMLLIPCHRVVGSTGKLVGFAGGLPMKEYLLKLEKSSAR